MALPCQAGDEAESFKFKAEHCFDNKQPFTSFGIQYEINASKKLSLAYSANFGYVPNQGFYFQTGAAQSLGVILLLLDDSFNDYDDYLGLAGFFCIIIPSEISYTVNEKGRTALRTYIKPLNVELFPTTSTSVYEPFDLSTEFGLKLRIQPGSFLEIVPQLGMKRFYFSKRNAFNLGVSVGLRF